MGYGGDSCDTRMARVGCFPLPTAASPPAHHTRLGKGEEAGTGSAQQRQGCGRPLGPPSPSSVPPGSPRLAVSPLSSLLLICVFKMYLQTHAASPAQPPSLPARVSGNRAKCVHKSSGKHTLLALPRQRHLGCPVSMRGCWGFFSFPHLCLHPWGRALPRRLLGDALRSQA